MEFCGEVRGLARSSGERSRARRERQILTEEKKEGRSNDKNWNEMTYEILSKVFMTLSIQDLASVSVVSHYWREVCREVRSDPIAGFWNKLDLSGLNLNSMSILKEPCADRDSIRKMTQFLNNALSLSNGKTSCLIFPYFLFTKDEYLIVAAKRSPNLKRLVLPGRGYLSNQGICYALQLWGGLESTTITGNSEHHLYFLAAVGKYCKNITKLKICMLDIELANVLVKNVPNLKALSVRKTLMSLIVLSRLLSKMEHLEVINICHISTSDRVFDGSNLIWLYRNQEMAYRLNPLTNQKLIRRIAMCIKIILTWQGHKNIKNFFGERMK